MQTAGTFTYGEITCSFQVGNISDSTPAAGSPVRNYGPFKVRTTSGTNVGPSANNDFIDTIYLQRLEYIDPGTGNTITLEGVKVATNYSDPDPILANNITKYTSGGKSVTVLGNISNYSSAPPVNSLTANLNLNLDTGPLEITKWKGKEDLLLQEISNIWKDIRNAIEAKNTESINIWKAIKQAESENRQGLIPVVVIKKNHKEPHAVVNFEHFMTLVKNNGEKK